MHDTHTFIPVHVPGPAREFHVTRNARERYSFSDAVFSIQGHVIFANLRGARDFAHRINRQRDAMRPDLMVSAGDIFDMGLIDEILHFLIARYRETVYPSLFNDLREHLSRTVGADALEKTLQRFAHLFPTSAVYREEETAVASLDREIDGVSGREVALEEMLLLRLDNTNPAFAVAAELFDDAQIDDETRYGDVSDEIERFLAGAAPFGDDGETLIEILRRPARLHPDSLQGQLEYIRATWGGLLGEFLDRLLRGLDFMEEEHRPRFAGPGPAPVLSFGGDHDDYAAFSPDRDWMPKVVLLAKSTLVWLDQLSRRYGREITTLDAIPDEELDTIATRGFTALWLIGLWQRSGASRRIKQMMGNQEAEASAYSLHDYEIADELGGWDAVGNLRERLWRRGIRLASDMVPNHVGLDGRWVFEHPDWFIQTQYPPFPSYSFNGENLSGRDDVGIYLEDHYFDRTDAAVVFRYANFSTGEERFIYHGNDGTSMPWNDTAQLDYSKAEVREAVIQTILHVARNFPVIRFDAAMTLARKHVQRLWFPPPGQGGGIPSRAEHGMTRDAFDAAVPREFWREVVDRVAREAPDTLLLAEAFWMMEGYFVRNLGMHRVYNSAFMNMLKNEENDKYRRTIKNTLEYDPEILKRFVNFMNNPDEETAIAQFGRDDKYFGVTTLMITMPGLPMFGHGQIEGYREKYGMEYRRAYWDEQPDQYLLERHEREVFPLLHKRHLFAESQRFRLFDFYDNDGNLNENVFAYTNGAGDERVLVLYNNSLHGTAGWIQTSSPVAVGGDSGDLRTERLAHALGVEADYRRFLIFREQRTALWYIRNCGDLHERGLYAVLPGYRCQVFLDFREVSDTDQAHYARLADQLDGAGTPNLDRALKRLVLGPLHDAFAGVANTGTLRYLMDGVSRGVAAEDDAEWNAVEKAYGAFLELAVRSTGTPASVKPALKEFNRLAESLAELVTMAPEKSGAGATLAAHLTSRGEDCTILTALLLLLPLGYLTSDGTAAVDHAGEWLLTGELRQRFEQISPDNPLPDHWEALVEVLLIHYRWPQYGETPANVVESLLENDETRRFLGINEYDGVVWFNREAFEEIRDWLFVVGLWHETSRKKRLAATVRDRIYRHFRALRDAEARSDYRLDSLVDALTPKPKARKRGSTNDGAEIP